MAAADAAPICAAVKSTLTPACAHFPTQAIEIASRSAAIEIAYGLGTPPGKGAGHMPGTAQ